MDKDKQEFYDYFVGKQDWSTQREGKFDFDLTGDEVWSWVEQKKAEWQKEAREECRHDKWQTVHDTVKYNRPIHESLAISKFQEFVKQLSLTGKLKSEYYQAVLVLIREYLTPNQAE